MQYIHSAKDTFRNPNPSAELGGKWFHIKESRPDSMQETIIILIFLINSNSQVCAVRLH